MASTRFSGPVNVTASGITIDAGGLTITAGGITVTAGGLTVTDGDLTLGQAVSQIVPGATSLSMRNNADNADNLILTDAGAATIRAGLTLASGNLIMGSADITEAELEAIDGVTLGTHLASKMLSLDANSELNSVGVIRSQDTLISSAQVLALNATPITIISAVGAGEFMQFIGAWVMLDFNSAAYVDDAGEDLVIQNLSAGTALTASSDGTVWDAGTDVLRFFEPLEGAAASTSEIAVDNGGAEITIQTGEWITGDSPLRVRAFYRQVDATDLEAIV